MKPLYSLILALCALCALSVSAQDNSKVLYFDANWKPCNFKKAVFYVEQRYINDTAWQWNYYNAGRPRWLSVQFKDEKGSIQHGQYVTYTPDGKRDTLGYYREGKRHGKWLVLSSDRREFGYNDGVLLYVKDSNTLNKEYEEMIKEFESDSVWEGKTFTRVEIESEFKGGATAWRKYLQKNLVYPEEAIKRNAQGMVVIQFIVNKEGWITEVDINRSVDCFIDREALRLIANSPAWIPAIQDGRKVKSYKMQPIGFMLP